MVRVPKISHLVHCRCPRSAKPGLHSMGLASRPSEGKAHLPAHGSIPSPNPPDNKDNTFQHSTWSSKVYIENSIQMLWTFENPDQQIWNWLRPSCAEGNFLRGLHQDLDSTWHLSFHAPEHGDTDWSFCFGRKSFLSWNCPEMSLKVGHNLVFNNLYNRNKLLVISEPYPKRQRITS